MRKSLSRIVIFFFYPKMYRYWDIWSQKKLRKFRILQIAHKRDVWQISEAYQKMRSEKPQLLYVDALDEISIVFAKIPKNRKFWAFFFFFFFFFFCEISWRHLKEESISYNIYKFVDDWFCSNQNLGILFYPPFPSVILLARKNPIFKIKKTNFGGH